MRHALFGDSNCVGGAVTRGDDWRGRPVRCRPRGQYAGSGPRDGRGAINGSCQRTTVSRACKNRLLYWLMLALVSKLFGINVAAARSSRSRWRWSLSVALIFLIGEKLTDYWRGFIAGLIYLSCCGTFLLARIVMPEPLVSAFIAGAIFCGLCGYQRRRHRRKLGSLAFGSARPSLASPKVYSGLVYPAAVFFCCRYFIVKRDCDIARFCAGNIWRSFF